MTRISLPMIYRPTGVIALLLWITSASLAYAIDPSKVMGPNACADCHKDETETWRQTHHFKTFREMPRRKKGQEIAKRMGVRRVKSSDLCMNCHFTVQKSGNGKPKSVAGISCESCHGGGKGWIKVHSTFSGKTEQTESDAEEAARWQTAVNNGMIRPARIYDLAKNCYSCHVVPQEDLVNIGGHPVGSPFELVSWTQGEIRHNTWYSKGKNQEATAARKRILYIVGLSVDIEVALRSIAKANVRKLYAFKMAQRADKARKKLAQAAQAAPNVPELAKIVQYSHSAGLKLNNSGALTAAADGVSKEIQSIVTKYDGTQLAAIDGLIPGPNAYMGKARQ